MDHLGAARAVRPSMGGGPVSATGGNATDVGTSVNGSQTGAAAAIAGTLPAVVGKTNYLTGIIITGGGATAASAVVATVTGVIGAPLNISILVPAGVGLAIAPLAIAFDSPLEGAAPNTAIVVSVPSLGAGNLGASVIATGYVL